MTVASDCLEDIRKETAKDSELQGLVEVVRYGWPQKQNAASMAVRPYFTCRDELSYKDDFVSKGDRIVIPKSLRSAILEQIHHAHLGAEGCLRRAQEVFYWPRMNSEMKDYISRCSICNTFRPEQSKEQLLPHDVPDRPWSKVATEIFMLDRKEYFITVGCYLNYWEVDILTSTTSRAVINKLRKIFSQHEIPETVMSDNGPQYASDEFKKFAKQWEFKHITSSPLHSPR